MNIVECIYSKFGSHDVKEESYLTNGRLFKFLRAVVMLNLISIRLRKLERNLELLNPS